MVNLRNIALSVALLLASTVAHSVGATRIDATTNASAETSWDRMLAESDGETQIKLKNALRQLIEASGFRGIALHAALSDPSVISVKGKVGGLTAAQIIELGSQASSSK